jgi:hypothetical protein
MADVCTAIEAVVPGAAIDHAGEALPFPTDVDAASFDVFLPGLEQTPLADGVAETIDRFRSLLHIGALAPPIPA